MKSSNKKSSFVQQAAILAIASLLSRVIGFIYRIPLTRILKDGGNSIYGDGYYIYMFFLILSSAGLPVAISKMVSARQADHQYRNAHQVFRVSLWIGGSAGLVFGILMAMGAPMFAQWIGSPKSTITIMTLAPTVLIVAIMSSFRGYFQGMRTSVPTAISQLIEQIVNAFFSVFLAAVLLQYGVAYAAAGGTAATGIGALVGLIVLISIYHITKPHFYKKVLRDKNTDTYESNKTIAKELISISFPIIVGTAVFSITNLIDLAMVKNILIGIGFTAAEADNRYGQLSGKYYTLTTLPISISTAFAVAAIPTIAVSAKLKDTVQVERKVNTAIRMTMLLSIPSAVGIGVLSEPILKMLFTSEFLGADLLTFGAVSIVFLSLNQITTGMLQGIGKVQVPAIAAIVGALFKIPLNAFLISIPEINAVGAVISTIFCYLIASCINLYYLVKNTNIHLNFTNLLLKPTIASLGMGFICYTFYSVVYIFTHNNTLSVLLAIIIGGATYFILLVLLRGFEREDLLRVPMGKKLLVVLDSLHLISPPTES